MARCIIGVLQYTSNLRGIISKYDSICMIESYISLRYFTINLSAIYQSACFVKFLPKIRVLYSRIFCYIYLAAKNVFKRILEIKEIIGIIHQINFAFIKVNTEIHIAVVVKAICQNRTEYPQSANVETPANINDFANIDFD